MISPRANEVQAVVDILESDEHEDSASMSKAIVKALAAELAKRESYCVARGLQSDNLRIGFGPFYGLADAKRVANANQAIGLAAKVIVVNPADDAMPTEVESKHETCRCGHPKALHGISMTTYRGKPKPMPSIGCAVFSRSTKLKCPCTTYEKG